MSIREHVQRADLGSEVILFELDLTDFGLDFMRFTNGTDGSSPIMFGGIQYDPWPIEAKGFELKSDGPLPRPKLSVANVDGTFNGIVESNRDLEGSTLTRIRTYERFLDGRPEADPTAYKPKDTYILVQKTRHDDEAIEWVLASALDQEGVTLPARKVVRDYCDHLTRTWNPDTASFDYTEATCPWTGAAFDANGAPCANADEVFSKRLGTCCQARFGATAELPFHGFPGVARIKLR